MKKYLLSICLGLTAMIAFSACDPTPEPSVNNIEIKSVTVQTTSITGLYVGDSQEIQLKINPSNANTSKLLWRSDNPGIATAKGNTVTGVGEGDAVLTLYLCGNDAKSEDDDKELGKVNVNVIPHRVESVTVTPDEAVLFKNKTTKLTAKVLPEFATYPAVTWSSADDAIATVDEKGVVTAVAEGVVNIIATADGKEGTCTVTVKNVDDIDLWTGDEAGSHAIIGGDSPDIAATGDHFLSYSNGVVSWTANTTGKVRSDTLTIDATGSRIAVTQIGPDSFKGTWAFRSQRFSNNTNVCTAAADVTIDVTIGDPLYGETLPDYDGKTYTNNLGLRGLYLDAVVDATLVVDDANKEVRFGLLLDERKAQAVENGNSTYPYVCFIPECGTVWTTSAMQSPWNFVPKPISATQNYQWLWFLVKDNCKTLQYDSPNKQFLIGKDGTNGTTIIGITCAVAKNATPAADDIFGTYNVIYQANPGKNNAIGGFMLTKK